MIGRDSLKLVHKSRFSSSGNLSRSSTNPIAWMTVLKPAKLLKFELRQKLFSNVIWPELLRIAPKSRRSELNASGPKTNRLQSFRCRQDHCEGDSGPDPSKHGSRRGNAATGEQVTTFETSRRAGPMLTMGHSSACQFRAKEVPRALPNM